MTVRFSRLRITGFKSFPESACVDILPGLTGIVGPNGCGKSNVVEALRWAMGESSARSLRGGEMDDVIFAGTVGRPARDIAEVALVLHDTEGIAPPPFAELGELEVVRRIERGMGSHYRINGKEIRARDVQTLFADLASGSRASAMVSQGRVGALVAARPEERRAVLEEAAGITGLHARRHEAELKLRQAETNLARAEDLQAQVGAQLQALKRQARQATRYRTLSGAIRQAEAELLAIRHSCAERARDETGVALGAARDAVGAALDAAREARARADSGAEALPALREAEADSRTGLERHRLAGEQIAAREESARAALADAERRAGQIANDVAHAEHASGAAIANDTRLSAEAAWIAEADAAGPPRLEAAEAAAAAAAARAGDAEREANRATEAAAESTARAQAAGQILQAAEARGHRVGALLARAGQEHDQAAAQLVDPGALARAVEEQDAAEQALARARTDQERAEGARVAAQSALAVARGRQSAAETARTRLAAEARALAEILAVKDHEIWPKMVDALAVPAGLEAALGAALGESLTSAADPGAARHWRDLPPLDPPKLPDGARSLAALARGPAALARALAAIGLVADDAAGETGQRQLTPGQILVSPSGAVWRWDGYTIRAGAPTEAAVRLRQRNRLAALRVELAAAEAEAAEANTARAVAETADRETTAADQRARQSRRETELRTEQARATASGSRARAENAATRLGAAARQVAALAPEHADALHALEEARAAYAALPDLAALRTGVERARAALTAARAADTAARAESDALTREAATRAARRPAIEREREDGRARAAEAAGRLVDLLARRREADARRAELAAIPAATAVARATENAALAGAEAAHRRAASALAGATSQAAEAERAARAAEIAAGAARENAIRAEAEAARADHAWRAIAEHVLDRLGPGATLPAPPEPCDADADDKARRKLDRLIKERDDMGPVNLRAEIEATEHEARIAAIERDRAEVATAIAKLRGSIGHLNREGRERLAAVFEQVDRQFQALFSRIFGGGRAHLALVGSDDPLEAGLEIYAQPPGKKLVALSLLSGGEQALTALSLIFAVFRCNPAPICVLDEVDAPLDDANVERFCGLLDDMARDTGTRFLVVTHHPLSMARMDRLYGVTMQERGVSRLLSVDLGTAERMVEPRLLAAE